MDYTEDTEKIKKMKRMNVKSVKSINQCQSVIQTINDIAKAHGGQFEIEGLSVDSATFKIHLKSKI
jgi:hypothetical protein